MRRSAVAAACALLASAAPFTLRAEDFLWSNVNSPDDLASTGDGWTASRAEDFDFTSFRCAADDFILTKPTRIERITYYTVPIADPIILGGDWYLFSVGPDDRPADVLASQVGVPLDSIDTGIFNAAFGTNVIANRFYPDDLVLPPGRYFLAFRSFQSFVGGAGKNGCLTTRVAIGDSRALWNFEVLTDGTVTDPWVTMDIFNGVQDQEWAFELKGSAGDFSLSTPSPGAAGRDNTLTVLGATPNQNVVFAAGAVGSAQVPGCPGVFVDLDNPIVLGSDRADSQGRASLTRFVPASYSGRLVHYQAAQPSECATSLRIDYRFR